MTRLNLLDEKMGKSMQKYLKAALEHTLEAGRSVREFSEFALEKFGDKALPHLRNFYQDVRNGNIRIKGLKKSPREILFGLHVTPQQREEMIRLAAYVRAEKRGFVGGSPEQDWDEAEKEVDKKLSEEAGLVAKGRKAILTAEETVEKEFEHLEEVVKNWIDKTSEKAKKVSKAVSGKKPPGKPVVKKKAVTKGSSGKKPVKKKTVKKKPV